MRPLVWIGAIAAGFGLGLAAGQLQRTSEEGAPADRGAVVAEKEKRIANFERQLRERDSVIESLQARLEVAEAVKTAPAVAAHPAEAVVAPVNPEPSRDPREEVDEPAEEAAIPLDEPPSATEEDAVTLFRRFLEKTGGMGWQQRMQHARVLLDELREMGEPAVTALLEKLEEGEDVRERAAAARLLGGLQASRAFPVLEEILAREEDLMLRRAAARGLQLLETPDSIPAFETILADRDDDRFVRLSAAYGLAQLGEPQGVAGMVELFDEAGEDGRGRFLVFRSLTHLNDAGALPLMRRLAISEGEVTYRLGAIRFLADHGDPEALPLLQQVMDSPNEQTSIVEAAEQAHAAISGGR